MEALPGARNKSRKALAELRAAAKRRRARLRAEAAAREAAGEKEEEDTLGLSSTSSPAPGSNRPQRDDDDEDDDDRDEEDEDVSEDELGSPPRPVSVETTRSVLSESVFPRVDPLKCRDEFYHVQPGVVCTYRVIQGKPHPQPDSRHAATILEQHAALRDQDAFLNRRPIPSVAGRPLRFLLVVVPDVFQTLDTLEHDITPMLSRPDMVGDAVLVGSPGLPHTHWPSGNYGARKLGAVNNSLQATVVEQLLIHLKNHGRLPSDPNLKLVFLGFGNGACGLAKFAARHLTKRAEALREFKDATVALVLVNAFFGASGMRRRAKTLHKVLSSAIYEERVEAIVQRAARAGRWTRGRRVVAATARSRRGPGGVVAAAPRLQMRSRGGVAATPRAPESLRSVRVRTTSRAQVPLLPGPPRGRGPREGHGTVLGVARVYRSRFGARAARQRGATARERDGPPGRHGPAPGDGGPRRRAACVESHLPAVGVVAVQTFGLCAVRARTRRVGPRASGPRDDRRQGGADGRHRVFRRIRRLRPRDEPGKTRRHRPDVVRRVTSVRRGGGGRCAGAGAGGACGGDLEPPVARPPGRRARARPGEPGGPRRARTRGARRCHARGHGRRRRLAGTGGGVRRGRVGRRVLRLRRAIRVRRGRRRRRRGRRRTPGRRRPEAQAAFDERRVREAPETRGQKEDPGLAG